MMVMIECWAERVVMKKGWGGGFEFESLVQKTADSLECLAWGECAASDCVDRQMGKGARSRGPASGCDDKC